MQKHRRQLRREGKTDLTIGYAVYKVYQYRVISHSVTSGFSKQVRLFLNGNTVRPRKNWVDVIKRDLRQMDLTWEEAEELVNDKAEWRQRVAQCSHLDAG